MNKSARRRKQTKKKSFKERPGIGNVVVDVLLGVLAVENDPGEEVDDLLLNTHEDAGVLGGHTNQEGHVGVQQPEFVLAGSGEKTKKEKQEQAAAGEERVRKASKIQVDESSE